MAKWKDLEAQGVKRCGAYFTGGKQCRYRADEAGNWCAKHRPIFDANDAATEKAIKNCDEKGE